MERSLREKLDKRVAGFIEEMQPRDGSMFTYSELMPLYKDALQDYAEEAFKEKNQGFINENLSITSGGIDREITDGADELLSNILILELAKIIYDYGINDEYRPDLKEGERAFHRALVYFQSDNFRIQNKLLGDLGKYIYRNRPEQVTNQNAGCVLVFVSLASSLSVILASYLL